MGIKGGNILRDAGVDKRKGSEREMGKTMLLWESTFEFIVPHSKHFKYTHIHTKQTRQTPHKTITYIEFTHPCIVLIPTSFSSTLLENVLFCNRWIYKRNSYCHIHIVCVYMRRLCFFILSTTLNDPNPNERQAYINRKKEKKKISRETNNKSET